MNKQKFVEYLRSPKDLDKETLSDLEAIIKDYPYFMSARTLLAKAGKNLKSKNAKDYISSAAVYATDRGMLKRYINDELIFLNPMAVHESHEAELERDLEKAVKTNRIAAAKAKQSSSKEPITNKKKKPVKKSVKPKKEETHEGYLTMEDLKSESPSELDGIISELYKDMEELKVNRARLKNIEDRLTEEEAVDEAVKKATNKPKTEQETESTYTTAEQGEDSEVTPQPNESSLKTEEDASEEPKKESEESPKKKKEEAIKKASESRSARISKINQEVEISKSLTGKDTKSPGDNKETASPKKSGAKSKKTTARKSTTSRKSKTSKKSGDEPRKTDSPDKKDDNGDPQRKSQNEIIDQFIKNNPSITPAQNKDDTQASQSDLSGHSTELHPDIASEYLAEIYLEQGRKERALQIYEALIVRFPEKSLYFADIVKKINESS